MNKPSFDFMDITYESDKKSVECSDWFLGFLWGSAMALLLSVIFINTSISNTERKVDRAYVKGYTDSEKNCKI